MDSEYQGGEDLVVEAAESQPAKPAERAESPIRATKFLASLIGTHDEIFCKLIKQQAQFRSMTLSAWNQLLNDIKNKPA